MKSLLLPRWSALSTSFSTVFSKRQVMPAYLCVLALSVIPVSFATAASKALFNATPAALQQDMASLHSNDLDRIKKEKTTAKVKLVNIDTSALSGDSIDITLDSGKVLTFVKSRIEFNHHDSFTWFGNLPGMQGSAILVVNKGNVTGSVRDNGDLYKIQPVGNGLHAVIETNSAGLPPEHPTHLPTVSADRRTRTGTTPIPTPTPTPTPVPTTGTATIDVLVVYPSTVSSAVTDVASLITLAVAETNQAYINSGIDIHMNLVGSAQTTYSETGKTFDTMLSDLKTLSDVTTLRDSVKADVVVMLTTNSAYCGEAYQYGGASYAFGVVSYSCATGYYSFAHEIGHMQGANHNVEDATNDSFAYGHGYRQTATSPAWRTIMSYKCPTVTCPRLQYFSNPNLNYNGLAMGTPSANDNARVLNETRGTVAGYR